MMRNLMYSDISSPSTFPVARASDSRFPLELVVAVKMSKYDRFADLVHRIGTRWKRQTWYLERQRGWSGCFCTTLNGLSFTDPRSCFTWTFNCSFSVWLVWSWQLEIGEIWNHYKKIYLGLFRAFKVQVHHHPSRWSIIVKVNHLTWSTVSM